MRRLTCSIAIVVAFALVHPETRQTADSAVNLIALAKAHYSARRLANADTEITQGLALLRQERAARATEAPLAGPDGTSYRVSGSLTEPVRRKVVTPTFPDDAVRTGAAGIVTVEFVVKPDGTVDQIRVLNSVPHLDDAAKATVKQWRYEPPVVNGRPASVVTVEAMLFTWRTDPMPGDYLDMAGFYCEHQHYARAEGVLAQALGAIREEAKTFGTTPITGPPRVSPGVIAEPRRLNKITPVYPRVAQAARIQGFVILDAVVDVEGKVKGVRVLKSVPALDQAAVDAVRQWVYSPAVLNGTPVEVIISVTVTFTLR